MARRTGFACRACRVLDNADFCYDGKTPPGRSQTSRRYRRTCLERAPTGIKWTCPTHARGHVESLKITSHPKRQRFLGALIEQPLTIEQLSAQLAMGRTRGHDDVGLLERHGFVRVVAEHYATNGTERTATARRIEIRPQLLPGNDEIRTDPGRVRRGVVEW